MFTRRDFIASGLISTAAGLIVPPALAKGVLAASNDGVHNDRPVKRSDNGRLSGTSADVRQSSGERPPAAARATRARYPVHLLRRSK